jgi:hypothetical protein
MPFKTPETVRGARREDVDKEKRRMFGPTSMEKAGAS